MDKHIHLLGVFRRDPNRGIKVFDLPRKLGGELRSIEMRNRADSAAAVDDVVPGRFQVVTHRGNDTHTGHYDASFAHGLTLDFANSARFAVASLMIAPF